MDQDHAEALSAFFDGEPVDAELLADSLAQPDAAALLADFAAMRAHEQRDRSRPSPEFFDRMAPLLRRSPVQRLLANRFVATALAASLLLAAWAGGFVQGVARAPVDRPAPPDTPSRASTLDREAAKPSSAAPPPVTVGPPVARGGQDRSGPPLPARRVQLARWQDTSALVAEETQR